MLFSKLFVYYLCCLYLKQNANDSLKDADMHRRLQAIKNLPEHDKNAILYNLDALIRDAKTRLAYK